MKRKRLQNIAVVAFFLILIIWAVYESVVNIPYLIPIIVVFAFVSAFIRNELLK